MDVGEGTGVGVGLGVAVAGAGADVAEKVRKVTPFTTLAADALCMWPTAVVVVRAPATARAPQKKERAPVRLMAPSLRQTLR